MGGELIVVPDLPALARRLAEFFIERAVASEGPFRIALSGGETPKPFYELLATPDYARRIPWDRVHVFWGDERFVPYDDPASNYRMARLTLLDHVPLPAANIHPFPTDCPPDEAAARYAALLQREYGADTLDPARPLLDLNLLGMGEDGHTASLIPGQPVLEERERWAASVPHGREHVRLTMTYPVLNSSRVAAVMVAGAAKARMLAKVRSGTAHVPAAGIAPVGELIWFADRAAAGQA